MVKSRSLMYFPTRVCLSNHSILPTYKIDPKNPKIGQLTEFKNLVFATWVDKFRFCKCISQIKALDKLNKNMIFLLVVNLNDVSKCAPPPLILKICYEENLIEIPTLFYLRYNLTL